MIKGILIAVIGAVAYGFISVFTKFLVNFSVNSGTILISRVLIIMITIGIYLGVSRKFTIPSKVQIRDILLFGVGGYGGAIFLLAEAYHFIPMGQATMIHFSYPLFVALFMMLFFKEKLTPLKTTALVMTITGILALMDFNLSVNIVGFLIALISGAAFAVYMISVSKSSLKTMDPLNLLFYLATETLIVFGIGEAVFGEITVPQEGMVYVSMLGVAAMSIIGMVFTMIAIRLIGPTYTSMICVLEPVVALFCSMLIFREPMSVFGITGSILMLGVVLIVALDEIGKKNKERGKIKYDK